MLEKAFVKIDPFFINLFLSGKYPENKAKDFYIEQIFFLSDKAYLAIYL
jgi:hypothetical protein